MKQLNDKELKFLLRLLERKLPGAKNYFSIHEGKLYIGTDKRLLCSINLVEEVVPPTPATPASKQIDKVDDEVDISTPNILRNINKDPKLRQILNKNKLEKKPDQLDLRQVADITLRGVKPEIEKLDKRVDVMTNREHQQNKMLNQPEKDAELDISKNKELQNALLILTKAFRGIK